MGWLMPELMLKPGWPRSLRRTLGTGKKSRLVEFKHGEPVEVSTADMAVLKSDIGVSLFEVERDEKNRPRFVETVEETGNVPPEMELQSVAHV